MLSAGVGAYIYYAHFLKGNLFEKINIMDFFKNKFSNNRQNNDVTSNKEETLTIDKYEGIQNYSGIPLIKVSLSTILSHKKTSLLVVLSIITYNNRNKVKKGITLVKKYIRGEKTDEEIKTVKNIKESIENYNKSSPELLSEPEPVPAPEPASEPHHEPDPQPHHDPDPQPHPEPEPQPAPQNGSPSSNSDSGSSIHSTGEFINHPMDSVDNGENTYSYVTEWLSNIKISPFKKD